MENIARTRPGRVEAALRLTQEAQFRLRHAATLLTQARYGHPIGDPEAEAVARTIRELSDGTDDETGRDFETIRLELENLLSEERRDGKRPFTVTGIYEDNGDRWADVIWADSGEQAAHIAHAKTGGAVTVAGVVEGDIEVVA